MKTWQKPQRWSVVLYGKTDNSKYERHVHLGVVAVSVEDAITAVSHAYPNMRFNSINNSGPADIVTPAAALTLFNESENNPE